MAQALGILSLPLGIVCGVICGRWVYRGDLPQWVVATLVGMSCAIGYGQAFMDLSKWLAR